MGKRNAAAAIVDADRLQQFETPPKRAKHAASVTAAVAATVAPIPAPVATPVASPPPADPPKTAAPSYSPNVSASEFTLSKEFVDGTLLMDLALKQWRIGKPIGKGSFGEIFLASDDIDHPVTSDNAEYVVKIEPHSNGPLFVEIHCLLNTAKRSETCTIPPGMPEYIASGSHMFKNERYRFLILKRYKRDLHSLIKNKRVDPKSIPVIACQILDVLEHLHDQGYVHSDIKAENLMIGTVVNRKVTPTAPVNGQPQTPKNGGYNHHHSRQNGYTSSVGDGGAKSFNGVSSMCNGTTGAAGGGGGVGLMEEGIGRSRNLRPLKTVTYRDLSDDDDRNGTATTRVSRRGRRRKKDEDAAFTYSISPRRAAANGYYEELKAATEEAHWNELHQHKQQNRAAAKAAAAATALPPAEDRIHLIDFGLASKFMDSSGQHRPFCMDQRRAHDGTLEFTSRDAHMGAHVRRSDLECLGYNLVYWSRGFLPWKDEKLLNQPEQVHRMKEYFMADVREMLRLVYGDDCPAYLGEFMAYVGQLTYDARPDYNHCRALFVKELRRLTGGSVVTTPLRLDVDAIERLSEPLTPQDEAEVTNKINHVKSLMKLGGALFPYRESTLHSKATSPKNLRSKRSDAARNSLAIGGTPGSAAPLQPGTPNLVNGVGVSGGAMTPHIPNTGKRDNKKHSCEEIFATDADQIARERVEKEFERAEQIAEEQAVVRYTGKPTYAIQELERKLRNGGHSTGGSGCTGATDYTESEGYIKGYTKPMMDILRKRQSQLFRDLEQERRRSNEKEEEGKQKAKEEEVGAEEDEDEEDGVEDDHEGEDDEEMATSETNVVDDDDDEEQQEEEDEEEASEEGEDGYEQPAVEVGRNNHYTKGGSLSQRGSSKGSKKEDTDSDFINDGGCEEEEEEDEQEEAAQDSENEDEVEEDEEDCGDDDDDGDDQHDSDFNDQESSLESEEEEEEVRISRKGSKKNGARSKGKGSGSVAVSGGRRSRQVSEVRPRKRSKSNASKASKASSSSNFHDNSSRKPRKRTNRRHEVEQYEEQQPARQYGGNPAQHNPHHLNNNSKAYYDGDVDDSSHDTAPPPSSRSYAGSIASDRMSSQYHFVKRRKSGLRERIRPTDRGTDYQDDLARKRKAAMRNKRRRESAAAQLDESSIERRRQRAKKQRKASTRDRVSVGDDESSRSSTHSLATSEASSCSALSTSTGSSSTAASSSTSTSSSSLGSCGSMTRRRRRRRVPTTNESSPREDTRSSRRSSVRRKGPSSTVSSSNGWNRSATNSRSSSVSASNASQHDSRHYYETAVGDLTRETRLATLPEDDDFIEEDDDDTRDVDYSPICTRGKRKTKNAASCGADGPGTIVSRRTNHGSSIAGTGGSVRKRNDSKAGGGGHGRSTTDLLLPTNPVTSSTSSMVVSTLCPATTTNHHVRSATSLHHSYRESSQAIVQPADVLLPHRARRYQHHRQYRQQQQLQHQQQPQHHYFYAGGAHHRPEDEQRPRQSTMVVRTYSRG
ncbi:uncharacterized protein LOC125956263 isoform X2 [Anopheles darlingi]|uniref:uncharacterized protein LOC125956263 isoform X2 n=1 Tax=Anopheles darlingi TaxID=43151 RepID=UPI0021004FEC|nr:uncharacterized protein LOC125956263 isoform X2 [Anopheles darlingi]